MGWFITADKLFTVQELVAVNVTVHWRNSLTPPGFARSISGSDIDLFFII